MLQSVYGYLHACVHDCGYDCGHAHDCAHGRPHVHVFVCGYAHAYAFVYVSQDGHGDDYDFPCDDVFLMSFLAISFLCQEQLLALSSEAFSFQSLLFLWFFVLPCTGCSQFHLVLGSHSAVGFPLSMTFHFC